jgi:hypothetical protein
MDAKGKTYYIGELGNRHLFLNLDGENLKFYLGGQIKPDDWKKGKEKNAR